MRSIVEKTLRYKSNLTALDGNGEAFALCNSATLPHAWTGQGGLVQKVGRRRSAPGVNVLRHNRQLEIRRANFLDYRPDQRGGLTIDVEDYPGLSATGLS